MNKPERDPEEQQRLDREMNHAVIVVADIGMLRKSLDAGANPNAVSGKERVTPLVRMAGALWPDKKEFIKTLLAAHADPNFGDKDGRAPLHKLACMGRGIDLDVDCVRLLLEGGAKIDAQDKDGMTPLHMAVETCRASNKPDMLLFFLEKGASMTIKNANGETPLDLARKASLGGLFDRHMEKLREQERLRQDARAQRRDRLRRKRNPNLKL